VITTTRSSTCWKRKENSKILLAALDATGWDEALRTAAGPFTLFVPNDDAFALLGSGGIAALLDNLDVLADILLYHVVEDDVRSVDLTAGSIPTLNTDEIHVDKRSSGNIFRNGNTWVLGDPS
jgi:uncharacterized surface protein with fasciclin (FAS1) repeats